MEELELRPYPTGHKRCSTCHQLRPFELFPPHPKTRDRRDSVCRECKRNAGNRWNRKKIFGMTQEDYDHLLEAQGGVCAICGQPEMAARRDGTKYVLAVDHDHRTGVVRGLLCHACNQGLGHFDDEPELLRAAIAYLMRNQR